jgi:hypothetical protein
MFYAMGRAFKAKKKIDFTLPDIPVMNFWDGAFRELVGCLLLIGYRCRNRQTNNKAPANSREKGEPKRMKIKVKLSIGYLTAQQDDIIKIDDAELEGKSAEEKEEIINAEVRIWANDFIETWWEEVK